jgi:hypothetical protein
LEMQGEKKISQNCQNVLMYHSNTRRTAAKLRKEYNLIQCYGVTFSVNI